MIWVGHSAGMKYKGIVWEIGSKTSGKIKFADGAVSWKIPLKWTFKNLVLQRIFNNSLSINTNKI